MPDIIKPPALEKGDTIGVMAPSSYVDDAQLKAGQTILEDLGYHVQIHPQTRKRHNQSAGSSAEKVQALHDLVLNPDIQAVFFAGGGNRALHIIQDLNLELIAHNPKIMMGFSDCTALLSAIQSQTGLITYHGPTLTWLSYDHLTDKDKQIAYMINILSGQTTSYPMDTAKSLKKGAAHGHLVGGNLSIIMALMGTSWAPNLKDAILFIEDTGDELSWFDRHLWQLSHMGALDVINGIIFGSFSCGDTGKKPFGFTFENIIKDHLRGIDIPIVTHAPFGHKDMIYTLPFGAKAELNVSDKAILTFDKPPVGI